MNKGFLTFTDDNSSLTVLKEEPEDLTHLAPQAGDVCIPLDMSSIPPDMLDDVLFPEAYGDCKLTPDYGLLSDDPCFSVGSSNSSSNLNSPLTNDPFLNYREDSLSSPDSCGTASEFSLSKSGSISDLQNSKSNTPDLPSLESPVDRFANLDLKLDNSAIISSGKNDLTLAEEDFDMRAPYIPMNTVDDFPLLSPSNSVMWGPQDSPCSSPLRRSLNSSPVRIEEPQKLSNSLPSLSTAKSSLAALLQSGVRKESANLQTSNQTKHNKNNNRWQQTLTDKSGVKSGSKTNNNYLSVRRGFESGGHIVILDDRPSGKDPPLSRQYKNGDVIKQPNSVYIGRESLHSQSFKTLSTSSQKIVNTMVKPSSNIMNMPIEQKQSFPSPPDPPPKRHNSNLSGPPDSPKRMRVENGLFRTSGQVALKDSVLLNLLVNGEDASNGYHCSSNRFDAKSPFLSYNHSADIPKNNTTFQNQSVQTTSHIPNQRGTSSVPSLLYISQHDAEVNAPIQPSYLLQGEELLKALDQTMKDVTAIV